MAATVALVVAALGAVVAVPAARSGAVQYEGSTARLDLNRPVVDVASTPDGNGYWLVASDGGIFSFGDARFYGSTGSIRLNRPVVGMAATATGRGYWLVASDGGVFAFGDARFSGSTGGMRLNRPIVRIVATVTGHGYWLVASDGGIFSFGDARFYGSTGSIRLNRPVVGMAATATGRGYWLVASDGGVFTFGDARFYGSTGGMRLAAPIVGIAAAPRLLGYWLLARDGGVFAFGLARFMGSAAGTLGSDPAIAFATPRNGTGYLIVTTAGAVDLGTPSGLVIDRNLLAAPREAAIAADLAVRINEERAARGLGPLAHNLFLAIDAQRWATTLAATNSFAHQDLNAILVAAGGGLFEVAENLYAGNGSAADSGSAHIGLMESAEHRANILLPEHQFVGIGAACSNGTLWVVEDFGVPSGTPLPPHPIPPEAPIVRADSGGPSC